MPHLTNSELEQHKEEKEEVAKNIGIDLRQFSIEELYSAWIRNVLIILCATIGVFSMYNHCQDTCELYHKIALSLLLITVLLMLISSSIDYKNRIKQIHAKINIKTLNQKPILIRHKACNFIILMPILLNYARTKKYTF